MTPNMKALDIKRPGAEEEDDQDEMITPEIGGMTRKIETVMPLAEYEQRQMQMGSPAMVPEEMMDPELMRRMGM